jgi:hypothetical protein
MSHHPNEIDRGALRLGDGMVSPHAYRSFMDHRSGDTLDFGHTPGAGNARELNFSHGNIFNSVHDVPVGNPSSSAAPRGDAALAAPATTSSPSNSNAGDAVATVAHAGRINFTTPEQNSKHHAVPDFILKSNGQLVANPDAKPHDGPVNVEVQMKNKSLNDAIKQANENQKKAIRKLITLWKKDHPNEQVPGDWIDQLNAQPNLMPTDNASTGGGPSGAVASDRSAGGGGGGTGGGVGGDGSGAGVGGSGGGGAGGGDAGLSPSGAQLSGGEQATAKQIMDILTKQYGLSEAGAAGVVGNMTQENSLRTDINSGGVGLIQWIGSRATAEEKWASDHGMKPTDLKAQLGFMMHELQQYPDLLKELKTTNNPQQAALDFSRQYERPGDPQNGNRESCAQSAYNHYKGTANA